MFLGIQFISLLCGLVIWFSHARLKKWYWKSVVFITVLCAGWIGCAVLGYYIDGRNGLLSYLTNSPIWLILVCSVGVWAAKRKSKRKIEDNEENDHQ